MSLSKKECLQILMNVLAYFIYVNTEMERVHIFCILQRISRRLRGINEGIWKMAPERRTEAELLRLRQVPPVIAAGY